MTSSEKKLLITIDGPAGAGKSTVSRALARRLGYTYVDTGALYRAAAYYLYHLGTNWKNDADLKSALDRLVLAYQPFSDGPRLTVNGVDVSGRIRTGEISQLASKVSARPLVRAFLLQLQRDLGAGKAAVFEGRDMGSVVFPHADVKFFLTADPKARAYRRFKEMPDSAAVDIQMIIKDIKRRDARDAGREIAPLAPADDAVIVDTTLLKFREVVEKLFHTTLAILKES